MPPLMDHPSPDPAGDGWLPMPGDGFATLIGPFWHRPGADGAPPRFAMLADARHANFHGVVHGGMLMSFADTALGITIWEVMNRQPCVTIQFGMQFLDAVQVGEFVEADVEVLRRSATVVFARAMLRRGAQQVGSVEGVWKVLRARA